jgi:hypothetical protein
LKNKSSTISGQNTLNLSHLSAFELFDVLGDYPGQSRFSDWIGCPYRSHFDRRAIRFESELIFIAAAVGGITRDA